jgi:VWFA-related protein
MGLPSAGVLIAAMLAAAPAAQPDEPPVPTDLEESVEVRLVTIDFVALDAEDNTVADLTKDDLELWVDRVPATIDTFDAYCDAGVEPDADSRKVGSWTTPKDLAHGTRRIIFAFDYLHLTTAPCPDTSSFGPCFYHTQALRDLRDVLEAKRDIADEEMMVVALTGGLRVEQPFTTDRQAVIDALRRMEHDTTLWNGNFAHLTEQPLYVSLSALITVLRMTRGPKSVVFFSAGPEPGNFIEPDWDRLASSASDAQVALYTVDCMGVFAKPATGGQQGLARLASMTGGRFTQNTNDYSVAYGRARRDLGCRYTIGFYDHHPELDKRHEIIINARRKGLKLYYATRYSFSSKKEQKRLAIEAAYLVPQQFEGGGLRAHLFPVQLQDAKQWNVILAVDFPADFPGTVSAATREFGVVLRRGSELAHSFSRTISVERSESDRVGVAPRVTFVEPVTLSPGKYSLNAVLTDPAGDKLYGRVADLTIPKIPKREAILAGPILGRRRGNDVVVYGGGEAGGATGDRVGDRKAFRPLLITDVDRSEPLGALTHACVASPKKKDGPWTVWRRLDTSTGETAGLLDDLLFGIAGKAEAQCQRMFDELPVAKLKPGDYTFRAVLKSVGEELTEGSAPFAVKAAEPR